MEITTSNKHCLPMNPGQVKTLGRHSPVRTAPLYLLKVAKTQDNSDMTIFRTSILSRRHRGTTHVFLAGVLRPGYLPSTKVSFSREHESSTSAQTVEETLNPDISSNLQNTTQSSIFHCCKSLKIYTYGVRTPKATLNGTLFRLMALSIEIFARPDVYKSHPGQYRHDISTIKLALLPCSLDN